MDGDGAAEDVLSFAEFVGRQQRALLRLAYLLAGDRGHAEDLVQTALMKTYRHWDRIVARGEPSAYVRRALVTTHTSWRRRAWHREQPTGRLPDVAAPDDGDRHDRDEALARALAALPPRMRATVVLRYYEDLSELQTAQLMGCSESTVNTQAARGGPAARGPLRRPGARRRRRPPPEGIPVTPEEEVRAGLHVLADRAGTPSTDAPALARSVAGRAGDRRRRQRNLLAAAGAVVLLAIAVPRLVDRPQEAAPASGQVSEIPRATGAVPPPVEFFDAPPRGSLTDDEAFLDGLRAIPGRRNHPCVPPTGRSSTTSPTRRSTPAGWCTPATCRGPLGPRRRLDHRRAARSRGPASRRPAEPCAGGDVVHRSPGGRRRADDLGDRAPGRRGRLAGGPVRPAHRHARRRGRPGRRRRGVAAAARRRRRPDLPRMAPRRDRRRRGRHADAALPRAYDGSTSYRVLRDGQVQARDMPWSLPDPEHVDQPPPIEYPRGRPDALGERAAWFAVAYVLDELGLPPAQTTVTAQWVGRLPSGPAGQAAVVTVTLPSGALVVSAQWISPRGRMGRRRVRSAGWRSCRPVHRPSAASRPPPATSSTPRPAPR
ncbi:SigE family RNA polymerase sigma factor [Blastococcus brunescens]|uniref:SigE family RNA polymerase sigma factor n=1 Tax=Blastococcus brunescens TaxID=1564165 RepID=A0ABZ1ATT3_9ACTN|nr:SigE family RNA polymerase sigma factor [Blastococcus sp. BMG 8361]WRL61989.1 SigE family RNA polymerase sigma factor [Blastococcus sp. BMG 8361]